MSEEVMQPIITIIRKVKEPRKRPVSYPVEEILFLVISGIFAGCVDWNMMEEFGKLRLEILRKYFPYINGIPCYMTISRLISIIDPKEMNTMLHDIAQLAKGNSIQGHIALDGKHIGGGLYTVSAYATTESLVLSQSPTYTAGNELSNIRSVLDVLKLKGCVITIDSIAAQHDIIEKIKQKGGEAIIGLKGNQKYIHLQVKNLFDYQRDNDFKALTHTVYETTEKGHGRIEKRKITVLEDVSLIPALKSWLNVSAVAEVSSYRFIKNKESTEFRYYLLTRATEASQVLQIVRAHWAIENCLHWTIDVNLLEDKTKLLVKNCIANIATLKRIVLGVIRQIKPKNKSVALFHKLIAIDKVTLEHTLQCFVNNNVT